MEILFVGTGAADYQSAFDCSCDNCFEIRRRGSRNLRHYSSLLLDGAVLVDCGPTVPWRIAELDLPPSCVKAIVFTHAHDDHLDPGAVASLLRARVDDRGPLRVYGNSACLRRLADLAPRLKCHQLTVGQEFAIDGLIFTPLEGNHGPADETALNFIIKDDQGSLFYATDTAWPLPHTWRALQGARLDAVIAEATFGLLPAANYPHYLAQHLNWPEFLRLRDELIAVSAIGPQTPFLATHLSLHHLPCHDEFSHLAQPPVVVAHDGLRIAVGHGVRM